MQSEEPVNTIMFVSGRKPQAIIEQDLQRRGLKVEWANSIKGVKGFPPRSNRENGHRRGPRLGSRKLDILGRASKVFFVAPVIGSPLVQNPLALDRSVITPSRIYCLL